MTKQEFTLNELPLIKTFLAAEKKQFRLQMKAQKKWEDYVFQKNKEALAEQACAYVNAFE